MLEAAQTKGLAWFDAILTEIREERAARIRAVGDVAQGAILRQEVGQRWAFLLPDMGEPGKWRIQYFDLRGFSGHGVYDTPAALVDAAILGGYLVRDDAALDRVQDVPSFRRGCFAGELIDKINAGLIDYETANSLLAQYDRETVTS